MSNRIDRELAMILESHVTLVVRRRSDCEFQRVVDVLKFRDSFRKERESKSMDEARSCRSRSHLDRLYDA